MRVAVLLACCSMHSAALSSDACALKGLGWFARLLRVDNDGDMADTFLEEAGGAGDHHAAGEGRKDRALVRGRGPTRDAGCTEPLAVLDGVPVCAVHK